jgi:hypothetical protein
MGNILCLQNLKNHLKQTSFRILKRHFIGIIANSGWYICVPCQCIIVPLHSV